ncbi:MAG: FHA domain-containing protein [Candidatus Nealsonbacteria bacterium]|nr:FHA domain-containing protein [Candidatus Nealsonbacteria bacterium]
MSLARLVYYSAIVGGWAAFLAWMVAEWLLLGESEPGIVRTAMITAIVGAAIATGLNLVSGRTNAQWKRELGRLPAPLIGGGLGGAAGGLLGNLLYRAMADISDFAAGLGQILGWTIVGLAIGGVEGLWEGSKRKFRNGLIGGGLGGLLGGWLFAQLADYSTDMAARATAFVVLGVSIGALIGLAQVVLKDAWLTVADGFRPGRQLILGQTVTTLGRGDHLPMPLLGHSSRDLESEHARITRTPGGDFSIEDNQSRLGTQINGARIQGPVTLADGDLIRLGGNVIRFNLRQGGSRRAVVSVEQQPVAGGPITAPPPATVVPSAHPIPTAAPPPPVVRLTEAPRAVPPGQPSPPPTVPRIPPPPPPPTG